jgi:CHASE2 domain-containing sensor protein
VPIDGKLVVLKFSGDFQQGFQVLLEIGSERDRPSIELVGALPPNPELAQHLWQWRQLYRSLSMGSAHSRIQPQEIIYGGSVNRLEDCRHSAIELQRLMMHWLESASFRRLDQRLRESLSLHEPIRLLIRTQDPQLRRLPWHLWDFVERYAKTEMALSAPVSERVEIEPSLASDCRVKILAILGNSQDINVQADADFLQSLPEAVVTFLVEPPRQQINQQLWEQAWDILFFAGHSATEGERGLIYINPQERLNLEELKYGLKQAISRGLQLAIFNSCDGLGLAQALEPLHLPQMIVMREPVPDRVAQEFLKYLLAAFSGGKSLYLSVREARERLQGIEDQFPCATWLPVICQNSAKIPPTWQELVNGVMPKHQLGYSGANTQINQPAATVPLQATGTGYRYSFIFDYIQHIRRLVAQIYRKWPVVLVSLAITVGLIGIQPPWKQAWELGLYDQMMQQRPDEGPDPRLLIVEVTDADIAAQRQSGETLQRQSQSAQSLNQPVATSLSDQSLNRLLAVLEQYQPRVIGLDIYRDFSVDANQAELTTRLRQTPGLITVCKAEDFDDPAIPSIDPPPEVGLDRVGFSDFREEVDGILRRHLLGMMPILRTSASRCNADSAFSVQVAAEYLHHQQIATRFTDQGDLQLGDRVVKNLRSNHSGYPLPVSSGSQILLNYRSSQEVANRVTLQQILRDQINPEYLKDKIVLVGVTAAAGDDQWLTPISPQAPIPGVIIQAHMISQLLSAALDQRPILTVLSSWQVLGWVETWAMVGGILASRQWQQKNMKRSLFHLIGSVSIAAVFLYGLCFLGLIRGKWLLLVPPLLALTLSGSIVIIYLIYQAQSRSQVSSR